MLYWFQRKRKESATVQILKLTAGDRLELKKAHPCGCAVFRLVRVGGVCRIICTKCGRDTDIDRIKLERAVRRILPAEQSEVT